MTKRDIWWQKSQKGEIERNFFVTPWISSKLNDNWKGHVLPTLIQFHVRKTSIVKVTFNKNSGGRLAPDTHCTAASWKGPPACPESAHTSHLSSWTPAQHSVTDGSYSKCMWQATRDGIFGSRQCLVLVAWPRILLFRVVQIGVKETQFNGIFAPTSWSPMSKLLGFSESLGKSVGKKWSQIWRFLLINGVKSPWKKKFFTDFFLFVCSVQTSFCPHFPKSNVQTFWIFGILGEKYWKKVVSDLNIFANKGC